MSYDPIIWRISILDIYKTQDLKTEDLKTLKTTRPQVKTQDLSSRLNIVSLYMRGEFDQGKYSTSNWQVPLQERDLQDVGTVGGVWSVPLGSYRAGI
jgi:hypothetical protein